MILDELEQERCNKNLITINTKCTFGWPGLVEDPGGRGGGGKPLDMRVLACNVALSYISFASGFCRICISYLLLLLKQNCSRRK